MLSGKFPRHLLALGLIFAVSAALYPAAEHSASTLTWILLGIFAIAAILTLTST